MNTLIDIIRNRYSCRTYLDKPIEEEKLLYLEECMRLAPSAVNLQPWKFRIVRSAEAIEKLRTCYHRSWFNEAPLYILASVMKDEQWVRRDKKPHGDIDVAIAVEHLCLAATEQGLGTCWVCNFDVEAARSLFDLPAELEPVALVPIGYPAEGVVVAEKNRKPVEELFF